MLSYVLSTFYVITLGRVTNLLQEFADDGMESRTTPILEGGDDEDIAKIESRTTPIREGEDDEDIAMQDTPTPRWTHRRPIWLHQNCQKNSGKYRKKIVKVFASFSENVLNFYRPHPTSVVGANFCGCIFCDPCSEKSI